ncbi:MAG: cysteine synthase A [Bacillota bacterium]
MAQRAAAHGERRAGLGILARIGNTPMLRLERMFPGAEVFGKLEGTNPGGSVKDRIALAMVEAAEAAGLIKPGDTLVEATSGNTGIGLALVAAVKGYRLVLTMPEDMNLERRALFAWFGAELALTPAIEGMSGAVWAAEQLSTREGCYWTRQFENPANPEAHYRHTGPEIWSQMEGRCDVLVAGVGTGGTLTGTARYLKERNPALRVVAVEPAASAVLSGGRPGPTRIFGLGAGFKPGVLDTSLIDQVVAVPDDAAYETARRAAVTEGLLVGPSSGAALWAVQRLLAQGLTGRIAVVLPDTGDRYTSLMPEVVAQP